MPRKAVIFCTILAIVVAVVLAAVSELARTLLFGWITFLWRTLPKVTVNASTKAVRNGDTWTLTTELQNSGNAPALMVRVKPVRDKSGDRILPAIFSDNYVALMPGEKRVVTIEVAHADTRGESPRVVVEGFNVP